MSGRLRELLREHWVALAVRPAGSTLAMRVAALPVQGATGPICAALDHAGGRHLLVPLAANESVATDTGSALQWRQRGLEDGGVYVRYADLGCDRPDLADVFDGLCADVLIAIEEAPSRPLKTTKTVVSRWRALFTAASARLGTRQLAGLFGELLVLQRLLQRHTGASRLWTGPTGHRHDFTGVARSAEVKTSLATEGRRVRVHGLDQLEEPVGSGLDLVWIRLEEHAAGRSVPALVDDLLSLADDEHDLLARSAMAGYLVGDRMHYVDMRFRVVEECWFEVDGTFPRIVASAFATPIPPVTDVHYTIDLLAEPAPHLVATRVEAHLAEITGSAA